MPSFLDAAHALHAEVGERRAHPYVGAHFDRPRPGDFRVLAVGINPYVTDPTELAESGPSWWSGWFDAGSSNFQKTVWNDVAELADALRAARSGKPHQSRLDPPPAGPRVAHPDTRPAAAKGS